MRINWRTAVQNAPLTLTGMGVRRSLSYSRNLPNLEIRKFLAFKSQKWFLSKSILLLKYPELFTHSISRTE